MYTKDTKMQINSEQYTEIYFEIQTVKKGKKARLVFLLSSLIRLKGTVGLACRPLW